MNYSSTAETIKCVCNKYNCTSKNWRITSKELSLYVLITRINTIHTALHHKTIRRTGVHRLYIVANLFSMSFINTYKTVHKFTLICSNYCINSRHAN